MESSMLNHHKIHQEKYVFLFPTTLSKSKMRVGAFLHVTHPSKWMACHKNVRRHQIIAHPDLPYMFGTGVGTGTTIWYTGNYRRVGSNLWRCKELEDHGHFYSLCPKKLVKGYSSKWVTTWIFFIYQQVFTHLQTFYQLPGTSKYWSNHIFNRVLGSVSVIGSWCPKIYNEKGYVWALTKMEWGRFKNKEVLPNSFMCFCPLETPQNNPFL